MLNAVSLEIDNNQISKLDIIANNLQENRNSVIKKAINNYLDTYNWQISHIKKRLKEADENKFVSDTKLKEVFESFI
ncbi:MAG: CopG family ribbon-helix-helix protein [Alphaproteobacteria bacterium]|nr:MAG: hypothetical protein B6I23_02340 [Rickettsiaceae bacterium 4572_127]